jgi:hypothetical protein
MLFIDVKTIRGGRVYTPYGTQVSLQVDVGDGDDGGLSGLRWWGAQPICEHCPLALDVHLAACAQVVRLIVGALRPSSQAHLSQTPPPRNPYSGWHSCACV